MSIFLISILRSTLQKCMWIQDFLGGCLDLTLHCVKGGMRRKIDLIPLNAFKFVNIIKDILRVEI